MFWFNIGYDYFFLNFSVYNGYKKNDTFYVTGGKYFNKTFLSWHKTETDRTTI